MKTTMHNEAAAPANVRPSSVSKSPLPPLDFKLRRQNRSLSQNMLLGLVATEAPEQAARARVVGKWVWMQFSHRQPREITATLSQLGFHWNRRRKLWQHPCGCFAVRRRYASTTATA